MAEWLTAIIPPMDPFATLTLVCISSALNFAGLVIGVIARNREAQDAE